MTSIEEARLRVILRQTQQELFAAEAELATRMTEIREFDAKIEARLGALETDLNLLDTQIRHYQKQIYDLQQADMFPNWVDYSRRVTPNHSPAPSESFQAEKSTSPIENELRQSYRELARKYHPDTAFDDLDRQYRHEMMLRINEAYANGDLTELRKHTRGMVTVPIAPENLGTPRHRTSFERVEAELIACQTRLRETRAQIEKLRFHPSVQLSLNIKLAWRQGKDLIGEMTKEYQEKIAQKTRERDTLFEELQQLQE